MKRVLLVLVILSVGIGVYRVYMSGPTTFEPEIRTVEVTRGEVVATVGATGTLEALTTVQVGSQVSGHWELSVAVTDSEPWILGEPVAAKGSKDPVEKVSA